MKEILKQDIAVQKIIRTQQMKSEKLYKWSQFVLPFEFGGRSCIFHTLTRQGFEITDRLPSVSACFSYGQIKEDAVLTTLMQGYFLVPIDKDECAFYENVNKLMRLLNRSRNDGYAGYTVLPTFGCNAHCIYCYENGRERQSMSSKMVEKTIAFILATRRKQHTLHLNWFGGEPLMEENAIDRICNALKDNGINYYSSMISNGSLITEKIARKMSDAECWNLKDIQISMDCAEQEYVRRKNYCRYDNAYWRVMENVNILMRHGVQVRIRCNVDEENVDEIPAFLDDLKKTIQDRSSLPVYFAPLYDSRPLPGHEQLWEKIFAAWNLTEQAGFQPAVAIDISKLKVFSCMADNVSGNVVIAPNGDLYRCEHCIPGTSYGDIEHGVTRPGILASFANPAQTRDKCRRCVMLPICTSFAKCPLSTDGCQEIMDKTILYALHWKCKETSTFSHGEVDTQPNC